MASPPSPIDSFVHPGPDPAERKPRTGDQGAIHKKGARGRSAGCYVVTRNGDLVLVHPSAFGELKDGQRLATQDDIDRKVAEEAARAKPPAASSAPSSSSDHVPGEHDVK